jgi:hypothetical protein
MRIAFIAGCLEPGRDGVGDYTRSLAAECARRGHTVALLSLAETETKAKESAKGAAVLRLTPGEWRNDNGHAARRWLDEFAPDWASLQFVPYSFDPRGFFRPSIAALAHVLGGARRRHVFFHETWIGSQKGAPLKARVFGWWQRRAVRELLRRIAPACVHTSTGYYCAALATLRQQAGRLPVFGSVPRPGVIARDGELPGIPPRAIVCGHFGTLHPGWKHESFLADFAALAAEGKRPAAFVAAGSLGYGAPLFEQVAAKWQGQITCVALGKMTTDNLSAAFARFDFGVTSVPWNILGKSSSAAALREHGLRVVVTDAGAPPRFAARELDDAASDEGFVPYFRDRTRLAGALEKTASRAGVEAMAERFLADLDAAK